MAEPDRGPDGWKLAAGSWRPGRAAWRVASVAWRAAGGACRLSRVPGSVFRVPCSGLRVPCSRFPLVIVIVLVIVIGRLLPRRTLRRCPSPQPCFVSMPRRRRNGRRSHERHLGRTGVRPNRPRGILGRFRRAGCHAHAVVGMSMSFPSAAGTCSRKRPREHGTEPWMFPARAGRGGVCRTRPCGPEPAHPTAAPVSASPRLRVSASPRLPVFRYPVIRYRVCGLPLCPVHQSPIHPANASPPWPRPITM